MATTHQIITVIDSETSTIGPEGTHTGRDITIQNLSASVSVYLGGSDVTTTSFGYKLSPSCAWSVELRAGEYLYARSDSSANIAILMLGLESTSHV